MQWVSQNNGTTVPLHLNGTSLSKKRKPNLNNSYNKSPEKILFPSPSNGGKHRHRARKSRKSRKCKIQQ